MADVDTKTLTVAELKAALLKMEIKPVGSSRAALLAQLEAAQHAAKGEVDDTGAGSETDETKKDSAGENAGDATEGAGETTPPDGGGTGEAPVPGADAAGENTGGDTTGAGEDTKTSDGAGVDQTPPAAAESKGPATDENPPAAAVSSAALESDSSAAVTDREAKLKAHVSEGKLVAVRANGFAVLYDADTPELRSRAKGELDDFVSFFNDEV